MSGLVSKDQTGYSLKLMDPAFKTLIMDESKLIRFTEGFPSFSLQAGSNTVRVFFFFSLKIHQGKRARYGAACL